MKGLFRGLRRAFGRRGRILAEIAKRRGETLELGGIVVDLATAATALVDVGQYFAAEQMLLPNPAHANYGVRALAELAFVRAQPASSPLPATDRMVKLPGLIEVRCTSCGRSYEEVRVRRELTGGRIGLSGSCPVGHGLPGMPLQLVMS